MKIAIGLGNPGKTYKNNRHNIGFMAADKYCEQKGLIFEKKSRFNAEITSFKRKGVKCLIVKPMTYMNLSGTVARNILNYYRGKNCEILVIYDDFHLPLGSIRIREKGSSGGHNGMESIISETGTNDFKRLRLGIETELFRSVKEQYKSIIKNFVLNDFSRDEKAVVAEVLPKAVEIMQLFFSGDIKTAMNLFNVRKKRKQCEDMKDKDVPGEIKEES